MALFRELFERPSYKTIARYFVRKTFRRNKFMNEDDALPIHRLTIQENVWRHYRGHYGGIYAPMVKYKTIAQ